MTENHDPSYLQELRLFLEEICCHLCRFHQVDLGVAPEDVRIKREVHLGIPGAFADISVQVADTPPYFVEVKYGYPPELIIASLIRKYGADAPSIQGPSMVLLVIDAERYENWLEILEHLETSIQDNLELKVWNEKHLLSLIRERYGLEIDSISEENVVDLRIAIEGARGRHAFGEEWADDSLQCSLLWHFGSWKLKQLRQKHCLESRAILPPGMYEQVAVVMADLSSFSSYVRDTRDDKVIRHALTSYYSKARLEVLNTGGMLYQFVGDEVVGLYGLPDHPAGYVEAALECAKALVDIGNSVSHQWQQQIDRMQESGGVHIGMAIGEVQIVSLRSFGRAHLGAVSDAINTASRLLAQADSSEIVVSNTFYRALDWKSQVGFLELEPVEAYNIGRIKAWKLQPEQ